MGRETKARESLAVAQYALTSRHNNSCVNRCYYACFQAAVAALLRAGLRPHGQWTHKFVQSRFAGDLIARRKRYPARLSDIFSKLLVLRQAADYETTLISDKLAGRAVRDTRQFLSSVLEGGENP